MSVIIKTENIQVRRCRLIGVGNIHLLNRLVFNNYFLH